MKRQTMKRWGSAVLCAALLSGAVFLFACGEDAGTGKIHSPGISDNTAVRSLAFSGSDYNEYLTSLAVAMLQYCYEENDGDNVMVSAPSLAYALALCANGAGGETQKEMLAALGVTSVDELNAALGRYTAALTASERKNASLKLANAIWLNGETGAKLNEGYQKRVEEMYGAGSRTLPFSKASSIKTVNDWCSDRTDGMIPHVVDESTMTPDTVMLLMNALSFNAKWANPFPDYGDDKNGEFHGVKGTEKVTMMHETENLYVEGKGEIGFIKPYEGGEYAFVALLPKNGSKGMDEYLSTLSGKAFSALLTGARNETVIINMPKFKSEYAVSLEALLKEAFPSAFDAVTADFSQMVTLPGKETVFISDVLQKTFIEVDSEGTRAAAVTVEEVKCASVSYVDPKVVTLDRPFVYAIVHTATGTPVFIGTVESVG